MSWELRKFKVTCSAGVGSTAAPQVSNITIPVRIVRQIDVRVPPGPRGEMGFALGAAGQIIYPLGAGSFMVTDDELVQVPLTEAIESGAWQVFMYNTGTYDHSIEVRLYCDVVQDVNVAAPSVVLASQPDLSSLFTTGQASGGPV